MKRFSKMTLAAAIGAACMEANAGTLVFDFSGTVDVTFDPAYHSQQLIDEYTETLAEDPANSTFYGQVILPDFENYLTGNHQVNINSNNLHVAIVTGWLGGIEGLPADVTAMNPDYVEGVANCTTRGGCDFDSDGIIETPRNNNPEMITIGTTALPDSTQQGDSGVLTIDDGKITSFNWYAGPDNTGVIEAINNNKFEPEGWQTRLGEISVDINGSTNTTQIDQVYFSANQFGNASITMIPEADTYAMWLAGLGVVGFMTRRRTSKTT